MISVHFPDSSTCCNKSFTSAYFFIFSRSHGPYCIYLIVSSSFPSSGNDKGTLAEYPGSRKNGRLYRSPPGSITRCSVAFILPPVDSESVLPRLTTKEPGRGLTSSQLPSCNKTWRPRENNQNSFRALEGSKVKQGDTCFVYIIKIQLLSLSKSQ